MPSGWYHQVHNLEDTISVNHNWCKCRHVCLSVGQRATLVFYIVVNAFNIAHVLASLLEDWECVKREISDCRSMDNWHAHCQLLLRVCQSWQSSLRNCYCDRACRSTVNSTFPPSWSCCPLLVTGTYTHSCTVSENESRCQTHTARLRCRNHSRHSTQYMKPATIFGSSSR